MDWINQLKARFTGRATPKATAADLPLHQWTLEHPAQQRLQWMPMEIDALLSAERCTGLCYATCEGHSTTMQSVILGFDLNNGQILLDEFFPAPASGLLDQTLALTLTTAVGILRLEVIICEAIPAAGGSALVANVLGKSINQDRRQLPRVVFDEKRAPTVEVLLPMTPLMKGHVVDLSEGGLLMSFSATEKPSLYTRNGECKIQFDDQFTLKTRIKIKEVRFHRKPFRHILLRALLLTSIEQKEQLSALIAHIESTRGNAHQAA